MVKRRKSIKKKRMYKKRTYKRRHRGGNIQPPKSNLIYGAKTDKELAEQDRQRQLAEQERQRQLAEQERQRREVIERQMRENDTALDRLLNWSNV